MFVIVKFGLGRIVTGIKRESVQPLISVIRTSYTCEDCETIMKSDPTGVGISVIPKEGLQE